MVKFLSTILIIIIILLSIPSSNVTLASKTTGSDPAQKTVNSKVPPAQTYKPSVTPQNTPAFSPNSSPKPSSGLSQTPSQASPVPSSTIKATTGPAATPSQTSSQSSQITKLLVIDPGHGGADPGTSDFGLTEKNVTLDIAQRLDSLLKNAGIKTYMIRNDDTFSDHRDRIKLANSLHASMYISLHLDWFKDRTVSGTTTYYINKSLTAGNLNEITYAQNIQRELIKKINLNDRHAMERPDLAVLKYAEMPSVLVEMAFLSNQGNADLLATKEFRQKCAEGLFEGIRQSIDKIGQ